MAQDFVFSIQNDITAQKLNVARLSQEIQDSAITIALAGVTHVSGDDDFTVSFKADLPGGDVTLLDALVQNTSGEPLPGTAQRADGVALVQLEPAGEEASLRAIGVAGYAAAALVDGEAVKTAFTWAPAGQVSFQGVSGVDVRDGDKRDYMNLCVVYPLDGTRAEWEALPQLGPWPFGPANTPAEAGLTEPIVLTQFGFTVYVTQSGHVNGEIAEGVSVIAYPMQLVIDYYAHAVGTTPWIAAMIRYWVG
jgi:hypothetical protein